MWNGGGESEAGGVDQVMPMMEYTAKKELDATMEKEMMTKEDLVAQHSPKSPRQSRLLQTLMEAEATERSTHCEGRV